MKKLMDIVKKENMSVSKEMTINDAIELIYRNAEGCVVVLDNSKAVGILTERDIISFLNEHTDMEQSVISVAKKSVIGISIERSIEYALHILIDNNIRRLVILDEDGLFVGIVTQEMMISSLEAEHYRVNLKVSQVLSTSSRQIVTLPIQSSLEDAVSRMNLNNIGSILISNNGVIEGIITERDFVRLVSKNTSMTTPIIEVMSSPVVSVDMHENVEFIVNMMQQRAIRRVIVNDFEGNPIGVIGIRDIIKNIKGNYGLFIENKLKYTKQALNAINEVIFELYSDHNNMLIQWGNNMALQRYGTTVIDQSITTLIDEKSWSEIMDKLLEDGEISNYKIAIQEQQYLLSCSQCNIKDRIKAFFIVCKDVTEYELKLLSLNKNLDRRVKEEVAKNEHQSKQLFAQSRMAQMGEMISMIAHQWRQPLGAIGATVANLKTKILLDVFDLNTTNGKQQQSDCFNEELNNIEEYVDLLSNTIDDFRNFYKPNKEFVKVSIRKPLDKALHIIGISLKNRGIDFSVQFHSNKKIELYDSEIMQVILNLLKNAEDVLIEKAVTNAKITIETYDTKEGIILEICDNGGGISETIIEKIFDPYFSTKYAKNGTGLGLYMSKIIVEEHHGGKIHVNNIDDTQGTSIGVCFKIELKERL